MACEGGEGTVYVVINPTEEAAEEGSWEGGQLQERAAGQGSCC